LTPAPATILTDPARLRQLLMNLTANAIKFTESGSVTIRAAVALDGPEPHFVCEVEDTGIGIAPEHMERIFSPFDQADNSITRKYGGTGLGLTICRHIARELGGEIVVQSKPQQGSVFRFTIATGPLGGVAMVPKPFGESLRRRPFAARGAAGQRRLPPRRVLLVEDGESNRNLISLVLSEAGASVVTAANGREGVDAAMREPFDLVLMDMQMPVMDGYTAARALRAAGMRFPIIALTAHAMRDDEKKCLAAGCSGYLSKPVAIDSLIEAVASAVGGGEAAASSDAAGTKTESSSIRGTVVQMPRGSEDASQESEASPLSFADRSPILSALPVQSPKIQRIVGDFLDKLPEKLEEIHSALEEEQWGALADQAHWLKGTGGTVGFPCLTETALELERSAKAHNVDAARASLGDLFELSERLAPATV
jgi:CheY-like chemotaxis protein/HPt (histidine-containing phosphotransfer) domain-containing protein